MLKSGTEYGICSEIIKQEPFDHLMVFKNVNCNCLSSGYKIIDDAVTHISESDHFKNIILLRFSTDQESINKIVLYNSIEQKSVYEFKINVCDRFKTILLPELGNVVDNTIIYFVFNDQILFIDETINKSEGNTIRVIRIFPSYKEIELKNISNLRINYHHNFLILAYTKKKDNTNHLDDNYLNFYDENLNLYKSYQNKHILCKCSKDFIVIGNKYQTSYEYEKYYYHIKSDTLITSGNIFIKWDPVQSQLGNHIAIEQNFKSKSIINRHVYFNNQKVSKPIENNNNCCICFEDIDYKIALVPCGHAQFHDKCVTSLQQCPICLTKIEKAIKIFV